MLGFKGDAVNHRFGVSVIDEQTADFDLLILSVGLAATKHRVHPCHHLAGRERLGDVIVGACIQPLDPVFLLYPGADHDDVYASGLRILFQLLGELESRAPG